MKTITNTTIIYEANDGTRFDKEKDCVNYEMKMRLQKIEDADKYLKSITKGVLNVPDVFNVYEADVFVAHIETKDDFEKLDAALAAVHYPYADDYILESVECGKFDKLPCDVVVFDSDSYRDAYDIDKVRKQLIDCLTVLNK